VTRFTVEPTPLEGLMRITRRPIEDERGYFSRLFCAEEFTSLAFDPPIVQINHTLTRGRGTVRGLHFQFPPHAEAKIVSCFRGRVFDVAVDLRRGSPTFLNWHGEELSADNYRSLLIPRGFAHGFQTLENDCEMIYLHDRPYVPTSEGAINALDPAVAVQWPLPIGDMSARDRAHPFVDLHSSRFPT
jgi:dTDP-4-dehydrorhamnose 3,5-epimerase